MNALPHSSVWLEGVGTWLPLTVRLLAFLMTSAALLPLKWSWPGKGTTAVGLAAVLAFSLADQVPPQMATNDWARSCLAELLLGLAVGFSSTLLMEALRIAGSLLMAGSDQQRTVGPDEQPGSVWSSMVVWFGWSFFFFSGSHCVILDHLLWWCVVLPPGEPLAIHESLSALVHVAGVSFQIGWAIAAPVFLTQLLAQGVVAGMARIAPFWIGWTAQTSLPAILMLVVLSWSVAFADASWWAQLRDQLATPLWERQVSQLSNSGP